MRRRFQLLILILLVSNILSAGKESNKTKTTKGAHKLHNGFTKHKTQNERIKRAINDEEDKPFWAHRGKKQSEESDYVEQRYESRLPSNRIIKDKFTKLSQDPPFWGNRGRRDSSSVENSLENFDLVPEESSHKNFKQHGLYPGRNEIQKERREEISPFWGNRGRRNSDEIIDYNDVQEMSGPFWGNRGRRNSDEEVNYIDIQEPSGPFWGNRGRREEDDPFWGSRGRREDLPFWGHRGRRNDYLPFWGNRGRRSKSDDSEPFWGNRGRRKDLKDSIREAIKDVEEDIINLSYTAPEEINVPAAKPSLWNKQGRNSALKHLFDGTPRPKYEFMQQNKKPTNDVSSLKSESSTMRDNRIYAEEPHYIIVERSSRSSGEADPFIISRGKKHTQRFDVDVSDRGRRGALEEIVKSVKSDPYFIVRGKKDDEIKISDPELQDKFLQAKKYVCTTIELMKERAAGNNSKRDTNENERGRRATLKKLAEQLQIDPYFVSRGKKNKEANQDNFKDFISKVAELCN